MLDDRHYMRSDYRPGRRPFRLEWSATNILIGALVVAFFVQNYRSLDFQKHVHEYFTLTPDVFLRGYVWQLISYQFLHAGLGHLVFNAVSLWSFGNAVEGQLGKSRFLTLYFLSGIAGGLLQGVAELVAPNTFGTETVGASAAIFGVTAAFALLNRDAIVLLLFFFPARAINLLYISIGMAVILPFFPQAGGVAHAAHLGGILFGVIYVRYGSDWSFAQLIPMRRNRAADPQTRATVFPVRKSKAADPTDLPPQEFMSQEVDPILDKISAHGIQSLTERERQILQAARNRMSKR
jgi:membrane associated rhomboid family serine protease